MPQAARCLRLAAEADGRVVVELITAKHHFDADDTVERDLPRLVNHAHAAASDFLQQLIVAEIADLFARRQGWACAWRKRRCFRRAVPACLAQPRGQALEPVAVPKELAEFR